MHWPLAATCPHHIATAKCQPRRRHPAWAGRRRYVYSCTRAGRHLPAVLQDAFLDGPPGAATHGHVEYYRHSTGATPCPSSPLWIGWQARRNKIANEPPPLARHATAPPRAGGDVHSAPAFSGRQRQLRAAADSNTSSMVRARGPRPCAPALAARHHPVRRRSSGAAAGSSPAGGGARGAPPARHHARWGGISILQHCLSGPGVADLTPPPRDRPPSTSHDQTAIVKSICSGWPAPPSAALDHVHDSRGKEPIARPPLPPRCVITRA
jgi:hypothetical protein